MILLQGQGLARTFADEVLFENITIHIQENSRIAIVGRNGTGKSTLLKMLAGIEEPSLGAVSKKKDLSIGYLDQCYPVFPHRLGRNGASLRRCGNLEETSTKSS